MNRSKWVLGGVVLAGALGSGCAFDDVQSSAPSSEDAGQRAMLFARQVSGAAGGESTDGFLVTSVVVDANGRQHVRLLRTHHGLRVIGGDVVVHENDGRFDELTATMRGAFDLVVEPVVSAEGAVAEALRVTGRSFRPAAPELVVHARRGDPRLAWEVVVGGEAEDGTPSELHVFVDAMRGGELDRWDAIETIEGHGNGFYSGKIALEVSKSSAHGYVLRDASRGGLKTVDERNRMSGTGVAVASPTDLWGDGTLRNRQTIAVDAHHAMTEAWDYFYLAHGRSGVADDGHGTTVRVHFGTDYANAFFNASCGCVSLGDGKKGALPGIDLLPLASLDIVGHELTHGVTAATAALLYSGESGALNESTSDIFATMIERFAQSPSDPPDYLIGEEIVRPMGRALRSLAYPEKDGISVGCYDPSLGLLDVHRSSGVPNHFFYLLAEGTTALTHTCGTGAVFSGIGPDRAAQIWYRALTVYLTSDATMADAKSATLASAKELYGAASPELARVAAAWAAVLVL